MLQAFNSVGGVCNNLILNICSFEKLFQNKLNLSDKSVKCFIPVGFNLSRFSTVDATITFVDLKNLHIRI